jgi:predicted dehydrogenase
MIRTGIGIIGAGAIAELHADAYLSAGARVVAVMSRRRSSAERLARRVGAGLATDCLEQLLTHSNVLAVDICTPSDDHAAIAIAAARAGKHVHVEKPLALSLADADRVIAACHASGVKLMVGQTARYQAVSRALRQAVDAGDVGRPFHLELVWDHGTFWSGGWRGWQIDPARSGGHLVHNGVHAFDLVCWLLGQRPVRIYAQARAAAHPGLDTYDYWQAHLVFAGGATALCEVGYVLRPTGAVHRLATLYGTTGTVVHTTQDDGVLYTDGGAHSARLVGPEAMDVQIAEWLACLANPQREPPVLGADGRLALAVGLAAERSVRSDRPEVVEP